MYRKTALLILAAATLVACTVGRDWSTYRIRVVTDPKGAECYFERDGVITQAPEPTPVDLTMTSIGEDVGVVCSKEGFKAGSSTVTGGFFTDNFLRFNRHTPRTPETTVYIRLAPIDSNEESTSYDGDGASGQRGFSFR